MYQRYRVLDALISAAPEKMYSKFSLLPLYERLPEISPADIRSAVALLAEEGFASYRYAKKDFLFSFCVAPGARAFLIALREEELKRQRDKWKDRFIGYVSGVATALTAWIIQQALST